MILHKIKNKLLYPLWVFWRNFERKQRKIAGTAYIVMGSPRSGTSLMSELLKECGVYFGEKNDLGTVDERNPHGFYQHNTLFNLSQKFLEEAGYETELDIHTNLNLRAKGMLNKVSRMITRFRMLRFLKKFSQGKERWGFKMFPIFLYFWRNYLPQVKIVGVFRDPISSANSVVRILNAGGRYTFEQALDFWNRANRDLIYHLSVNEGILVKYDDLFDPAKQDIILRALVEFSGGGDTDHLKKFIESELNRSGRAVEVLKGRYPLRSEIRETLTALEKIKI